MSSSSGAHYTRQPMQIYQDPESFDHAPMPTMQSTNGVKIPSPLRLIKNASSRRNVVFNPPSSAPNKPSPLKSSQQDSTSPTLQHFHNNNKLNIISMPPPSGSQYYNHTDSIQKKGLETSHFQQGQQPPKPLFSAPHYPGKENYHANMYPPRQMYSDGLAMGNFAIDGMYSYQTPQKRMLMDSPTMQESGRSHKRNKVDAEPMLPSPITENFPVLTDDGTKPGHSYATLIGMAILRAPNRRLTLAQIYKWISDTYSFYGASDAGWQNSIRHNLSLNKAFVKQERPKDDPGKGNYWIIEPGMEAQFYKDKSNRKNASSSDQINPVTSTPATAFKKSDNASSAYKPPMTATKQDLPDSPSPFSPPTTKKGSTARDPDSDATIPASDSPDAEHELENPLTIQPSQSSPSGIMHSSPPILRRNHSRSGDDTPPSLAHFSASSNKRIHKRGLTSMDDSGYFSSLNSSVLRGNGENRLTETDKPKRPIKRGRAEEAIARLRGSSYDSPTKTRTFSAQSSNNHIPPSSSPLRRNTKVDASQMLPPLTPAVKLKAPAPAPPSVSPYTNLQMHRDRVRQLVGSPDRNASVDDSVLWTPQFRLTEEYSHTNYEESFDIFADTSLSPFVGNGSPARKTRRPGLERAHTANVLGEITSSERNIQAELSCGTPPPPTLKLDTIPKLAPSAFDEPEKVTESDSPVKGAGNINASTFELAQDDFFGTEFLADDVSEFDGVDISKGFQRIGAGGPRPKLGNARPGLGRSFTSIF